MPANRLSLAEEEMFMSLRMDPELFNYLSPSQLYRAAVEICFLERKEGHAVESLRRCIIAWQSDPELRDKNPLCRLTPEWDAMIRLE